MAKTNTMTSSEVKKGARAEVKNINTNPTYLMRKLNKFAQGKETDLNGLKKSEGLNTDFIKELYKRLDEAFGCGGFWWGSIIARQGFVITAAKKVEIDEPLYTKEGRIHTEVIADGTANGTLYSLKEGAQWSFENIIQSASLCLSFAEKRAKASGELYSWQKERKDAKAKASKKSKKTSKKTEEKGQKVVEGALFKAVQELQKAFANGKMTKKQMNEELDNLLSKVA